MHFGFGDMWAYGDFAKYQEANFPSPNFLYGIFINKISAEAISDPLLVTLAILFSVLVDVGCVYLFIQKFRITTQTVIMYLIFCLHPYFSFFTFRFDTIFFSKIACLLFLYYLLYRDRINTNFIKYTIIFLSLFRLTALLFLVSTILSDLFQHKPKNQIFSLLHLLLLVGFSIVIFILNFGYTRLLFGASEQHGWTLEYTRGVFGQYGLMFDYVIHYFSRAMIILGGRDRIYIEQFEYFKSIEFVYFELSAFFTLAVFHLVCLISFIKFSKKHKVLIPVLSSLSLFLLCLFTVGHLRYLVGYYPMILLGWLFIGAQARTSSAEKITEHKPTRLN